MPTPFGRDIETALQRDRAAKERDALAAQRDREAELADKRARGLDRTDTLSDRHTLRVQVERAGIAELTGARRRGLGLQELAREVDRARRTGEKLVVAYVDVDGLKTVNDNLGHSAGDGVLRDVAEGLPRHRRAYDLLVRLGGDEFLCVLPGVTAGEVQRRFQELGLELSAGPTIASVSIGLGELRDGEEAQDLIDRADHNLLRARSRHRAPQRNDAALPEPP